MQIIGEWLSGIALAWGARGPGSDSRLPDHIVFKVSYNGA